jgi:hypothetical protein
LVAVVQQVLSTAEHHQAVQTQFSLPSLPMVVVAVELVLHTPHLETMVLVVVQVVVLHRLAVAQILVEQVTRQAHHHHKATTVVTHQTQVEPVTTEVLVVVLAVLDHLEPSLAQANQVVQVRLPLLLVAQSPGL